MIRSFLWFCLFGHFTFHMFWVQNIQGSENEKIHIVCMPDFFPQIPAVPKRDRIALELAEKASKQHRHKKQEALKRVTASLSR